MARRYALGDVSFMSNEEITTKIIEKISQRGDDPADFLYRGLDCNKNKLDVILRTGTDRTVEGWTEAANFCRKLIKVGEDESRARTKPGRLFAAEFEDIEDAVDSVGIKYDDFGVVLVYRKNFLISTEDVDHEYELIGSPREALDSVFKFFSLKLDD